MLPSISIYNPRASYYVGGGEIVPLYHAQELSKLGWHVNFVTIYPFGDLSYSDVYKRFKAANSNIRWIEVKVPQDLQWIYSQAAGDWRRWNLESFFIGRYCSLSAVIPKCHLVAIHNILDCIVVPEKSPHVLHLHGYPEKLDQFCEAVLCYPRHTIAVSKLVSQKWSELIGKELHSHICYNGMDLQRFSPDYTVTKEFDFLYVGRLLEVKGVQYVFKAIELLRKNGLNVHLVVAGHGPYRDELEKLSGELKIQGNVTFLGYVSDEALPELFRKSRVAVLPSTAREGVLTTMLEAAATAVPSITTLGTSMAEFCIDGLNGLTVPARDVEAMADAMRQCATDPELAEKLGQQALSSVTRSWSWSQRASELSDLYKMILADA